MRLAIALLSAAALGVGVSYAATPPPTQLAFAVYPQGVGAPGVRRYTLRCGPAGGTVPHPAAACRVLASLPHPFAPVPSGAICSAIALGPQEAVVTGRLRGKPVSAHLTLRDSCEIERWRKLAQVVPGFAVRR